MMFDAYTSAKKMVIETMYGRKDMFWKQILYIHTPAIVAIEEHTLIKVNVSESKASTSLLK